MTTPLRGALFVVALAFFVLAVLPSQRVARAQGAFVCYGQTYDAPGTDDAHNYFWKSVSSCDFNVFGLAISTWLYQYHWDDSTWWPVRFLGGDVKVNTNWVARNGFARAPPYFGINCFSAWSLHVAQSSIFSWAVTASPGQCY